MSHASGLAADVRGSTESDTFDLAGQNVSTITTNITHAFQEPLPIQEMIRITFVTGAGKLARQKYDADAAKAVTSALRDLDFEEDRGASCIPECAGCYKLQHDTGKNLKTVVVFPRILENNSGGAEATNDGGSSSAGGGGSPSPFTNGSPEEMIALSSNTVFASMIKSQCPSWTQKKGCINAITTIKAELDSLDTKLLEGVPLSDNEQSFYDSVSSTALDEKQELVKELMHKQVDDGLITSKEKAQLLSQVSERLDKVNSEILEAEKANQSKKVEKLKGVLEKVTARKGKLSTITPKKPHPLKHEQEMSALRSELLPLMHLEDGGKGKLLSLKETQALARKEELLEEIAELEQKSRGWFEEDDAFEARVEASDAAWRAQSKSKKSTGKKTSGSGGGGGWATTTKARPKASMGMAKKTTAAKKNNNRGGGVFGAMMMDSDSD